MWGDRDGVILRGSSWPCLGLGKTPEEKAEAVAFAGLVFENPVWSSMSVQFKEFSARALALMSEFSTPRFTKQGVGISHRRRDPFLVSPRDTTEVD